MSEKLESEKRSAIMMCNSDLEFLLSHYSPMKKLLIASAIALTPLLAFANGTGSTTGTGTTNTGTTQTGTTSTGSTHGSGSMTERETKGLMLAIGALSPADRATLVKMIRDYLVSKGVDPAKYAEKREEIKEVRKEGHGEIKDMRKKNKEEMKDKRDALKAKIKEMRGNGKVNVQDISFTK
jgi:hypothetical protein